MKAVVLDASVFIAAVGSEDRFHEESRRFLLALATEKRAVLVPAFAIVEVACALSRMLRDAVMARKLTLQAMTAVRAKELPIDAAFLAQATLSGTRDFLRGADALYAAAAEMEHATLISWDNEHRTRAGARTPTEWLSEL